VITIFNIFKNKILTLLQRFHEIYQTLPHPKFYVPIYIRKYVILGDYQKKILIGYFVVAYNTKTNTVSFFLVKLGAQVWNIIGEPKMVPTFTNLQH